MQYRTLGRTGIKVSPYALGALMFATSVGNPDPGDSARIIHKALDAGINLIDTADAYGPQVSERLIADALHPYPDDLVIATKGGLRQVGEGEVERDSSPAFLRSGVEDSLRRLQVDHIDLYQVHWPDPDTPAADVWGAMAGLVDAGKVRHVGVSNFDRTLLQTCEAIRHVDSLQQEFSMLALEDRDLIRWCGEQGIGVVTYSPLAVGFLTGRYTREEPERIDDWRAGEGGWTSPAKLDEVFRVVEGLRPIAERLGITEVTVKAHLRNIYAKIGAQNRAHAVTIALQQKLIESGMPVLDPVLKP